MQRNLRMVLILVDGKSTVSDLVLKIGNQPLTESALAELEGGGFIAPHVAPDSLWSESKKVAQEIRSAALNKASQIVTPMTPEKVPEKMPEPDRSVISLEDSAFSKAAFPFPPMPFANADKPVVPPVKEKSRKPKKEKPPVKASDALGTIAKPFKGIFSGGEPLEQPDKVTIKPIKKGGQRKSLTWSAVLTLAFLFLIVLSVLGILFFPYGLFRADVEAAIARSTGQPVTVGAIRGEVYPKPGLFLSGIKIGKENAVVTISEARLLPEPGTLFEPKVHFRQAVLSGVTLPAELIGGLTDVFAALASPGSRFALTNVRFESTEVSFAGLSLAGLEGEAVLGATGAFQSVKLQSADRSINLEAKPVGARIEATLDALAWRPSEASRIVVNSANLKGVLENGALTLQDIELRAFDGLARGHVILRADKTPSLVGEVEYERINATRFGEAIGIGQLLAGDASGNLRFSAISDSWATIFSGMAADGTLSLVRGGIRGIDLPEAVRRVSRGPVQGGATQFEQFSGKIKLAGSEYLISDISINSGLMQSSGSVEVDKDLKLKGKMVLQMRGSANQMRVPVLLGGTLMVPQVTAGSN